MKIIFCWRTSNSNRFEGSSSDVTSDVSADAAAASVMLLFATTKYSSRFDNRERLIFS